MYEFQTEKIVRLTTDGFSEEDPDFHPTENVILFTSDRGAGTRKETTHIYKMDLDTREIQPIEGGAHADAYPEWAPDGKSFLFVSDREGTQNVYRHKGNVIVRQTNAIGGVTAPTVVPDGNSFIATVYEKGEFNLFEFPMRNGAGRVLSVLPADTTVIPWSREDYETFDFEMSDYRTSYAIDFVGVGISVDPEFGEVGNGGALAMTDVLGNHQIRFFFGTTTNDFDDFFQNISVGLTWVNQSRRVNYSVSIFNLNSVNRNDFITDQREKRVGGALGLSYALNKFQRLDGTFVVRHVERGTEFFHDIVNGRSSVTSSVFLTFVNDTSLWAIGGPAVSWRFYITAGQTVDWYGRGFSNTNLLIDFRKYVKLTRRSVFAVRYITRNTFGTDEQVYYLGGPWTLRGFGYRQFFGRTLHLVNSEIRFPLIDRFALTLPFGIIEMPMFRGSFFYDVGKTDRNQFEFFDSGWRASLGGGIELNLGYAPIVRVNFTRQFISGKLSPSTGFELFIGYNY